jgi:hypothetical protein
MLELALSEARATAGTVVHGCVHAPDVTVPVVIELMRLERSPSGSATYRVATAEPADDGTFELVVPEHAPPDVEGRDCSLHYALRAVAGPDEVRETFSVAL